MSHLRSSCKMDWEKGTYSDRNIWHYVNELLLTHDCVILPSFGGFVANAGNAHIERSSNTIHTPWKKITFNSRLKLNDGVLAMRLSDSLGISYNEAVRFLENEIQQIQEQLKVNRSLVMDNLGEFQLQWDDTLEFIPQSNQNFQLDFYGLGSVKMIPRHQESVLYEETAKEINYAIASEEIPTKKRSKSSADVNIQPMVPQRKRKTLGFRLIASFLIIILLINAAILISHYPIGQFVQSISQMGMVNIDSAAQPKMEPKVKQAVKETIETKAEENTVDSSTIVNESSSNNPTIETPTIQANETNSTTELPTLTQPNQQKTDKIHTEAMVSSSVSDSVYFIITGAFRSEENARNFAKELMKSGFTEAEVFAPGQKKRNKLHLVSIRTLHSRTDAQKMQVVLHDKYPSAWVMAE